MKKFFKKNIPIIISMIITGYIPSFLSSIIPIKFSIIVIVLVLLMSIFLYILDNKFPGILGEENSYAATGIVFDKNFEYILLGYHEKQKRWIPPGSHVLGVKYFHEEVLKSIHRETGYQQISFVELSDYEAYKDDNCCIVPGPYSVQIETQIPFEGHNEHYDLLYILVASKDENIKKPGTHKTKWVTFAQLQEEAKNGNTYPDVVRSVEIALQYIKGGKKIYENK